MHIHEVRKPGVLAERPPEMPERHREKPLSAVVLGDLPAGLLHLLLRIAPSEVWENRPQILLLLIHRIFQRQPEQTLIRPLIHPLMEGLIEQHQLLPVVMQMNRADDTVPVHICPPV